MYTLSIDDVADVTFKFTVKNKGVDKTHKVTLQCKRLDQEAIDALLEENERKFKGFMTAVTTGWAGQTLVLGPNGEPADFSAEALDLMLGVVGIAAIAFGAYLKAVQGKEKN